ncbi:MAG TPA: hypothetical protein VFB37_12885 [Steroidobacteraceae bacterium]|nr:hypothetical protein [Steroidobacteraceae bacterium]
MIRHILRKDWTLLWPLVLLVSAIQVGFEWATFKAGFFSANQVARELVGLLSAAWIVGILAVAVAAIYEDPIPGAEQDWLIRPIRRSDLLLAKVLFVLIGVCLPMLAVNVIHALALGFPTLTSFGMALYKELFVFACLLLPVMALASIGRNITELLVLGASLVVLYAAALGLSAVVFGAEACPTCDTAIVWIQHLLQHVGVFAGAIFILVLQYFRRRTEVSRAVALAGLLTLVFLQLPWGLAFAAQSWLTGTGAPVRIALQLAVARVEAERGKGANRPPRSPDLAHRATQALIEGNAGAVVGNLKHIAQPGNAAVKLHMGLSLKGLAADELLFADRTQFSIRDEQGRVLYRGTGSRASVALVPDESEAKAAGLAQQSVEIPRELYERAGTQAVSLNVDDWLTLVAMTGQHRISAVDGELRAPEAGLCRSKAEANEIVIVCKQLGRAPVCYSATLYAPDGRHNPEVLQCTPDYRPYLPALGNMLTVSAVELPTHDASGLAHYAVAISELAESYVVLKTYEPVAHFTRALGPLPLTMKSDLSADPAQ